MKNKYRFCLVYHPGKRHTIMNMNPSLSINPVRGRELRDGVNEADAVAEIDGLGVR
jgi:hypothetical protein